MDHAGIARTTGAGGGARCYGRAPAIPTAYGRASRPRYSTRRVSTKRFYLLDKKRRENPGPLRRGGEEGLSSVTGES
jgi:hypothetical protein